MKSFSDFLIQRTKAVSTLSQFYATILADEEHPAWYRCGQENGFFTEDAIRQSLTTWINDLSEENLLNWLSVYSFPEDESPKTIGVIAAGNIPLVGLHDLLSVLLSGHKILLKPSSSDSYLMKLTAEYLSNQEIFSDKIEIVEQLKGFDAVIATGSDNTNRYFEYYFRNVPTLLRKSRNSVAILNGNETTEELVALGHDVFDYFGMGCRSVSKLFVPKGYDVGKIFTAWEAFKDIRNHYKYFNNFEYHLAGYLVSQVPIFSNDWTILKENEGFASPIGVTYLSYYESAQSVKEELEANREHLQCVVGDKTIWPEAFPFGQAQCPALSDYADGVDTIDWLLKL